MAEPIGGIKNPLEKVLTYLEREADDLASFAEARSNANVCFDATQLAHVPSAQEMEDTSRMAGVYLGKQEIVSDDDMDLIVRFLDKIFNLAIERQISFSRMETDAEARNNLFPYRERALKGIRVMILEPMIQAMKEVDVNTNFPDFKKICKNSALLCGTMQGDLNQIYIDASNYLKRYYEEAFNKFEQESAVEV